MKIDTLNKTIELQGENLGSAVETMKDLFPNGEWKDYKVIPQTITVKEYIRDYYPQPYVIPSPIYPYPLNPLSPFTYGTGDFPTPYIGTTSDNTITNCVNNSNYQA